MAGELGRSLFIAGTDTGVGKTTVAVALCHLLREQGLSVGVFKPAETGCADLNRPLDALALAAAAQCDAPLDTICPYRFTEPLAPAIAAERAGTTIDLALLRARLAELERGHDRVVIEGAGGLLVPFAADLLTVDWIAELQLPVLLVGRLGLGTLNHTLLSARLLADRGVHLLATVLSATEQDDSVAARTNAAVLERFPEVRLAGVVAHGATGRPGPLPRALWARLGALVG